jgi:hypothetical protein
MYELLSLLVTKSAPDHLLNYNKQLRHNFKNRLKAELRNNLKNEIFRNASRSRKLESLDEDEKRKSEFPTLTLIVGKQAGTRYFFLK